MGIDTSNVDSIAFDSFSTLLDVESSKKALEEYTDNPLEVAQVWRQRALFYSVIANHLGYETYFDLHQFGLQYASDLYDLNLSEAEIQEINEVYYDLEPFDDVQPVMERLRDAGYDLYIISNGDPEMLDALVETADIGDVLGGVISADEIETLKPSAELYRHAAERAGTPAERMIHVSAAVFDVQGAQNVGMQGVWINRKGIPMDPYGETPDLVINSLNDLAAEFDIV